MSALRFTRASTEVDSPACHSALPLNSAPGKPARSIAAVPADPVGALRLLEGAAGAERVRTEFGLDRMVDETLAIYAELA